jgi:hypothetical protein
MEGKRWRYTENRREETAKALSKEEKRVHKLG